MNRHVLALVGMALFPLGAHAECAPGVVDLRGDWGTARFTVEVAASPDERAQGLMNRPSLARMSGMIFFFPEPGRASFWMRNTLIPLDMIFADENGVVVSVHANAVPLDETPISGGDGIKAVLEVNGGLAGQLGIGPGSQLRHPMFEEQTAAWPCE